jgi:hypothetical protein
MRVGPALRMSGDRLGAHLVSFLSYDEAQGYAESLARVLLSAGCPEALRWREAAGWLRRRKSWPGGKRPG